MPIDSGTEELSIDMDAFEELLNYQLVHTKKEKPTVFDISSYPHYENVISSWYAFFLDGDNPHGFENLFYSSLLQLLKLEDRGGSSCEVIREYGTDKGGRIDLLVFEGREESGEFRYPIIIENKIYAELDNNDLKDYYDSVNKRSSHKSAKLVLSLHGNEEKRKDEIGEKVRNTGYAVRSHHQYMEVIKKNLHSYIASADPKYFMLLQDFMSNIEKITRMAKMAKMDANSKKYFSNAAQIDQLLEMRSAAQKVVIDNFFRAISEKKDWRRMTGDGKKGLMSFSIDDAEASFYISLSGLKYVVKLYIWGELPQRWTAMSELERNVPLEVLDNDISGVALECSEPNVIAEVEYDIGESDEALDQYHDLIAEKIETEWMPFVEKLRAFNA